jgi:hypothetical protein
VRFGLVRLCKIRLVLYLVSIIPNNIKLRVFQISLDQSITISQRHYFSVFDLTYKNNHYSYNHIFAVSYISTSKIFFQANVVCKQLKYSAAVSWNCCSSRGKDWLEKVR